MIAEGTKLLLIGQNGKKFAVRAAKQMVEVPGLGVVDGQGVCEASLGDRIRVGGQEFLILRPGVKDILGMIERRAQIIISKDSFMIPMHLDLGCGGRVIEGGVGSGALTVVLLKAVGQSGRVYSYENREDYLEIARRNVRLSEGEQSWEVRLADICTANLESEVDAAMLDIPNPWDAMDNVFRAVRTGGYVGSYVPNANQLESAVKKMRDVGLSEVVSFETLQREMVVHEGGVRPSFDMLGHTGYLAFGRKLA